MRLHYFQPCAWRKLLEESGIATPEHNIVSLQCSFELLNDLFYVVPPLLFSEPLLELAHLPYQKGRSYEDYVGQAGFDLFCFILIYLRSFAPAKELFFVLPKNSDAPREGTPSLS